MWHRVFCASDSPVSPAALAERLVAVGVFAEPHFRGDDLGWTVGEFRFPKGSPLVLNRYLTEADDLRRDLNTFAAELETMDYSPNNTPLMEKVIQTKQLVTFRRPIDHADDAALDRACTELLRMIAEHSNGIFQIDGQGWFAADGTVLVPEY